VYTTRKMLKWLGHVIGMNEAIMAKKIYESRRE
jgi:hypothetical protein